MSLTALFASAFVIGLSGAVMPGPLLTVTITHTLRRGWQAALWLMCGHALLEALVVLGLASGMSVFVEQPIVLRTTAIIGSFALAWMAWGALRMARHPPEDLLPVAGGTANDSPAAAGNIALMTIGAAVSASNPYWLVWWATIGVTYVLAALKISTIAAPIFYLGHITSDFAWYLFLGSALSAGRHWLRPGAFRAVYATCGVLLAVFGVLFLAAGLGFTEGLVPATAPGP